MHPRKLGFDNCDLNIIQQILNKETQTSNAIIIIDSKTSVQVPKSPPPAGAGSSDKGSLTVFEFCQIVQDPESPESITVIKETISQEELKHFSQQPSEEGVANRYKYCKEVIKPYLKPCPPGGPHSEEKLIKEVLESVHKDFPDYQPCKDNYQELKQIDTKDSSVSKIDAVTSYDSKPSKTDTPKLRRNKMDRSDKCKPMQKTSSTTIEQRPGCFPTEANTPSGVPDPGCDNKTEKSEKKFEKPKCVPKKKSAPHICDPTCEAECAEKKKIPVRKPVTECPPPIDYCKKQNAEKKKKSAAELFGITQPVPPQRKTSATGKTSTADDSNNLSTTDSKCETLSQIKSAMEDFISKVYTTTSEIVAVIKTESAKQFEMFSKSSCNDSEIEDKSSERSGGYSVFRKDDSKTNDTVSCEGGSAGRIIENLVDKVDSAVSKISDTMDYKKLPESMLPKSFNDSSSPYDNPTPPKEIAHIIVQTSITGHTLPVPHSSSVFATIKTKICSLFCDEEKKRGSESSSSSNFSRPSEKDEDADLIDRLID